ncbi:hypothetical protein KDH_40560 [Dictyobacter sp. S3.2.2.5]|uniref:Uncharacterized protein n=1 Tax=Dictyobacter halimunensis TaxID=3026934 RepID=A0ABQ6FW46_9CHLR|nr:hypothetical protein KDH_40560 [Dictyobacter sp. S3.2.2.5]
MVLAGRWRQCHLAVLVGRWRQCHLAVLVGQWRQCHLAVLVGQSSQPGQFYRMGLADLLHLAGLRVPGFLAGLAGLPVPEVPEVLASLAVRLDQQAR